MSPAPSPAKGAEIRFLRGTLARVQQQQYVPDLGEPLWYIDIKVLAIGDGETVGGIPIARIPPPEVFTDFEPDGSARTLELAAVPIEATLEVRLNGLVCRLGETNDFVLDGQLVTYNYGLFPNDIVEISYFPEISEE
jgi:hypothetical protein